MVLAGVILHVIVVVLGGIEIPSSREAGASPWPREPNVTTWLREGESASDAERERDLFPVTRESVAEAIPAAREAAFLVGSDDIPSTREEDPRASTVPASRDGWD